MFAFNLVELASVLAFFVAVVLGLFLYIRAGKHELVEEDILFDSAIAALIGGLVGGRIVDFLLRSNFYNWSLAKLFFFNVYAGFNWYGALVGAGILSAAYLTRRRVNFWSIFDLVCAPIIFAMTIISLGRYFIFRDFIYLGYFLGFLLIFWIIKRLAREKKNEGFFVAITLLMVSSLNLILFNFREKSGKLFEFSQYSLALPIFSLAVGLLLLHLFSKRSAVEDIKNLGAMLLLIIFKIKRSITSIGEADKLARSIILSPVFLAKFIVDLVKLVGCEVQLSLIELLHVFGVKK